MKYDPSIIEIPVPRYFKEDDRIEVDVVFKEKVIRETEGGKKKKTKKVSQKKKKKKVDDEEKKAPAMPINEKLDMVDGLLEKYHMTAEPEQEV